MSARIGELKKRQFLSNFLQQHPGIQHKAGVPLGGTFILVYHGEPDATGKSGDFVANLGLMRAGDAACDDRSPSPIRRTAAAAAHGGDVVAAPAASPAARNGASQQSEANAVLYRPSATSAPIAS